MISKATITDADVVTFRLRLPRPVIDYDDSGMTLPQVEALAESLDVVVPENDFVEFRDVVLMKFRDRMREVQDVLYGEGLPTDSDFAVWLELSETEEVVVFPIPQVELASTDGHRERVRVGNPRAASLESFFAACVFAGVDVDVAPILGLIPWGA